MDRIPEITTLLDEAGAAHGRYEQTKLGGVYDEAWARWYAAYVVEQGISALLGHVVTVDAVEAFFTRTFADYRRDGISEDWSDYTAARLQAEL